MDLKPLFLAHVETLQKNTEKVLAELGLETLVLHSGKDVYYADDDMTVPFRPYHHFAYWCPLEGPGHMVVVAAGKKPTLYYHSPADYWHEHSKIGEEFWTTAFDVVERPDEATIWAAVTGLRHAAYVGPDAERAKAAGLATGIDSMASRLNWDRSFKTPYEVECTVGATKLAATGHAAAKEAFFAGGSELDIHNAFLRAMRVTELELPYQTIVCLNEKGAVLHYHRKRDDVRSGKAMLIDAGAKVRGYASDITRTYVAESAHTVFRHLLTGMETLQQAVVHAVKPGVSFADLHAKSHLLVARLLLEQGILRKTTAEAAVEDALTGPFYPHGLGHQLGLFVHDVAGKQLDRHGGMSRPNPKFKYLRTNRVLGAGNLITIEPGLYFIDMLLAPFREGAHREKFDWDLIGQLTPFGGIRIEDDVLVTEAGVRNLTREQM